MNTYKRTKIDWLMYPGMRLMRQLKFPAKTLLMGLMLLVPLTWLTAQALLASHRDLEATRLEVRGAP